MRKKYFAYGSCTNFESFKNTMRNAGCEDKFIICESACLITTGLLSQGVLKIGEEVY